MGPAGKREIMGYGLRNLLYFIRDRENGASYINICTVPCLILVVRSPGWSELQQGTSEFASGRVNVFDALPMVVAHLQLLAYKHTQEDAAAIAKEDI